MQYFNFVSIRDTFVKSTDILITYTLFESVSNYFTSDNNLQNEGSTVYTIVTENQRCFACV